MTQPRDYFNFFAPHVRGLRRRGDELVGLCPFHQDDRPSFSANRITGLWQCFGCGEKGDVRRFTERMGIPLEEISGLPGRKVIKTYSYQDEAGNLLFQTVRFEPKDFRQRRPDGKGGWVWNLEGIRRILYRLPDVLRTKGQGPLFILEGEKDVDRLWELGLRATCNPGGAGKWKEEYNQSPEGEDVVIIPDNDPPGKDHATQIAKSLFGITKTLRVIELPGLPDKGDISLWLGQGGTKEKLLKIIEATPEWEPPKEEAKGLLSSLLRWNDLLSLDVKTEYLFEKLIPKGSITLLFGRGGIGKTSLCLQIGQAVAEGIPFGSLRTMKEPVYFIDFENPLSFLKERVKLIGQTDNFYVWHISNSLQPPRLDTKEWELYRELPLGLLIFDTLRASHLSDENSSRDMAVVITRLKELREAGFTILLIHHTPKGNESIYKGSTAILDLADHVLGLEEVRDSEGESIEFDHENLYRLGVRIKTRYEPHHIFMKFNPEIRGFEVAKDPDFEKMELMYELLREAGKPLNQSEFVKLVKDGTILSKRKIERLIKRGIGLYWREQREGKRALIYSPILISQFPNTIYGQEIRKLNSGQDDSLGNSYPYNTMQDLNNTKFPNFPTGSSGNQEITEVINLGEDVEVLE